MLKLRFFVLVALLLSSASCIPGPEPVRFSASACTIGAGVTVPDVPPVDLDSATALFADDALPLFEVEIPDGAWRDICNKAGAYADYLQAIADRRDVPEVTQEYTSVNLTIQDRYYPDVGFRMRGRSTVYAIFYDNDARIPNAMELCYERRTARKPSFKISLDKFSGDGEIADQQTLNLISREGADSAYLREVLAHRLANQFGVQSPRAGHARLCVDGAYEGLFSLVEEADTQRFLNQHFPGEADGGYWKVENDGDQEWHSSWEGDDFTGDYVPKAGTDKDNPGTLRDLLALGDDIAEGASTSTIEEQIDDLVDVDQWLREIAIEMTIPDYDGMWGNHKNHLLYDHPDGFRIVPFDRDLAFVDLSDYAGGQCPGSILGGHPCWASTREGPHIARYLVESREEEYIATVQAFVDQVMDPVAINTWLLARADAMRPWIAADRYYQPDSPACQGDPDCGYFTQSAWEYAVEPSLTGAVSDRVEEVRRQLAEGAACSSPCGD